MEVKVPSKTTAPTLPVNRYTERLWELIPEWRPKDGA